MAYPISELAIFVPNSKLSNHHAMHDFDLDCCILCYMPVVFKYSSEICKHSRSTVSVYKSNLSILLATAAKAMLAQIPVYF